MKPSKTVSMSCSNRNTGKHKLDHHCLEQISKKTDCVLGTIYVNRIAWIKLPVIACWDEMSC